jgi:predicted RNA-binding protein
MNLPTKRRHLRDLIFRSWEVNMCQAKVYLGNEEVARDVVWLEPTSDGVRFETFFGGLHLVKGRVQRIDFMTHRVSLTPVEENHGPAGGVAEAAAALD